MRQGYDIYDIGLDSDKKIKSPFYALEKSRINSVGYPIIDISWMRPER